MNKNPHFHKQISGVRASGHSRQIDLIDYISGIAVQDLILIDLSSFLHCIALRENLQIPDFSFDYYLKKTFSAKIQNFPK